MGALKTVEWKETAEVHRHRHLATFNFSEKGNWVSGRRILAYNKNVIMSTAMPAEQGDFFYRNAHAYELIFVHKGKGVLESQFGKLAFR